MSWVTGFEKRALSLVGNKDKLIPGLRKYEQGGLLNKPDKVSAGVSIAPRSETPLLPTYARNHPSHNSKPSLPHKPAKGV